MLKIFTVSLLFISCSVFAKDPLAGRAFKICEMASRGIEREYVLEYRSAGEELEAEIYRKKSSRPCSGEVLFAIGRISHYEVSGNELITVLSEVRTILVDSKLIDLFNKRKFCGVSHWRVKRLVPCEGLDIFGEEEMEGYRTIHEFSAGANYLMIKGEDGESLKLMEEKKSP